VGVRVMAARWFTLVATTETGNWKTTPLIQQIGEVDMVEELVEGVHCGAIEGFDFYVGHSIN
jgi:hypothetical protein